MYIWDLNKPGESCLMQTLNGHSRRSFSVAWSPLLPDLLLSGSDDATARVWDVKAATCVALLLGHASEVRALCWHPEIPWLVFTGEACASNHLAWIACGTPIKSLLGRVYSLGPDA